MISLTSILLVSHHVGYCIGWSWTIHQAPHSGGLKITEDTYTYPSGDSELSGSHPDIEALLSSNDALQAYQRKPDCFQDAISLVKTRCEESRMDEQERVHAAIGLTMCELATARHYSPPMECATFAMVGYDPALSSNPQAQARCVDALSRSAQFWSSYSGYLREIPQLCFAFRRWIDIGTVSSELVPSAWDMRDVLGALTSAANGVMDTSDLLATTVINSSKSLLKEVANAMREIGQRDQATRVQIMAEFQDTLEVLGRDHSNHLSGVLSSIQSFILSEIDSALTLIRDESLRNLDVAAQLENRLGSLDDQLFVMHNSLELLAGVVDESSKLLEASVAQAQIAQAIQEDTVVSMTRLADTIDLLTQTTHAELETINRTTSALTESLRRSSTSDWLNSAVQSAFQLFPRIGSRIETQSLQLVLCIVNAIWYATRFIVSLLMSAFVLVNARRWLPSHSRSALEDTEASFPPVKCTHPEIDTKPVIVHQLARPRTRGLQRSFRYRYSRIPDRLCRPSDETWW